MKTFTVQKDALGYYWGHLTVNKFTHNTHKLFSEEADAWAKDNNYPSVMTTVDLDKIKFIEWLGFKKLRRVKTVEGIKQLMELDTSC